MPEGVCSIVRASLCTTSDSCRDKNDRMLFCTDNIHLILHYHWRAKIDPNPSYIELGAPGSWKKSETLENSVVMSSPGIIDGKAHDRNASALPLTTKSSRSPQDLSVWVKKLTTLLKTVH